MRDFLYPDHDPYAGLKLKRFDPFTWEKSDQVFGEAISFAKPKLIVEVGSYLGGSSRIMARICKEEGYDVEIVCIDTWLGSFEHRIPKIQEAQAEYNKASLNYVHGRPDLYDTFLSNTLQAGYADVITPFPIDSINGLLTLKLLGFMADMIYVDAAHDYISAKRDYIVASDILREGGVILGDDYMHDPVKRAAKDTFTEEKIIERESKFIWIK